MDQRTSEQVIRDVRARHGIDLEGLSRWQLVDVALEALTVARLLNGRPAAGGGFGGFDFADLVRRLLRR